MTQGIRTPRPMGTTGIAYNYHQSQKQEDKQILEQHLINHYITCNYTYCNKHYNLEQFSKLINVQYNRLMHYIIQYGNNIRDIQDTMTNGDSMRALLAMAIQGTLEDRGRALEQYSILASSQGGSYKPFVSGEVTKALKLVMESGQNLGGLIKNLSGGGNINILNQFGDQGKGDEDKDYVTTDSAVMMIKEVGVTPLAVDEGHQAVIYDKHGLDDMPEVNALKQEGVDTSKEALDLNKLSVDMGHIDRRATVEDFDIEDNE